MGKNTFRKQLNKDIKSKMLLTDASLYQIVKHVFGRVWVVVKRVYDSHTQLVWELFAGLGWALLVLKYWGIV